MPANVRQVRVAGSMTEFKKIIGRGTRVRDDSNKLFFNILDYTGSATAKFADPNFDGYPALITESEIDEHGQVIESTETAAPPEETPVNERDVPTGQASLKNDDEG